MVAETVKTCPHCGHTGEDVISYFSHLGANGAPVFVTNCADIDKCMEREAAKLPETASTLQVSKHLTAAGAQEIIDMAKAKYQETGPCFLEVLVAIAYEQGCRYGER